MKKTANILQIVWDLLLTGLVLFAIMGGRISHGENYYQFPGPGITAYPNTASLPLYTSDGTVAATTDTYNLYIFEAGSATWVKITSGGGAGVNALGPVGAAPNANAAVISGTTLSLEPASASFPGVVTTGTQTLAGNKTLSGTTNLSALTASKAVVTDGSKNLASLTYDTANTATSLVERDGSGNFAAGTITATLTGTASGNTTYTPNNHGAVISGSGNGMTVIAPNASTAFPFVSGGASADPSWALLTVPGGGTGLATATAHGVLLGEGAAAFGFTGAGTAGQVLTSNGASADPTFQTAGGGLTVGSTTIASGTTTKVLFDNAGVLGEYTITGTGNVVMSASPTLTGTITAAALSQSGQHSISLTGAASTPSFTMTGSPFTGGSGTTTKPVALLEDAATSTGWSTAGTYLGINAKSGFVGNLIDAQINGVSLFSIDPNSGLATPAFILGSSNAIATDTEVHIRCNGNNTSMLAFDGSATSAWTIRLASAATQQTTSDLFFNSSNTGTSFAAQWVNSSTPHFIWGRSHSAASAEIMEVNNPGAAQSAIQFMNSTTGYTPANVGMVVGIDSSGNGLIKQGANTATTFASTGVTTFPVGLKTTVPYLKEAAGGADCSGGGTLSGGTATITTTCAAGTYRVFVQDTTTGALTNVGILVVSAKNSGNFVVTSTIAIDTSTFDWEIHQTY